jgi:hypothetical protein
MVTTAYLALLQRAVAAVLLTVFGMVRQAAQAVAQDLTVQSVLELLAKVTMVD